MFSVNIDKLVAMTDAEQGAYDGIGFKILAKGKNFKTIAVLGNNMVAFKLAESIRKTGNSVLFVDADFASSVFLGKYKLGKNLKGICDYLTGEELPNNIICYTNKEDFNVVFTGDVESHAILEPSDSAFCSLMSLYKADYDYVILTVGDNTKVAKNCDGTIVVMENNDYSDRKAKKEVQKLDKEGCLSLGIVVNNA